MIFRQIQNVCAFHVPPLQPRSKLIQIPDQAVDDFSHISDKRSTYFSMHSWPRRSVNWRDQYDWWTELQRSPSKLSLCKL
ncbi:hypothetical protein CVT26_009242 [Gymnopilus dilepis]|uniref:Uncharacterized protein n=1 Tax=Gymnopilus dilepis TaxID=231916 RepID=A0A409YRQ3_9AGAR|nr:hypothetical protein CVT26_009242 [Gymnopilus dilepis]